MIADTAGSVRHATLTVGDFIFGTTPGMHEVRMTLEQALSDDLPVLIEGESGTGKEMAARYLHLRSGRALAPFVRVNCGAVSTGFLEKEIFGGIGTQQPGNGSMGLVANGTLFLDEIVEMDSCLQQKVVEALKNSRFGNEGAISMNARIVCASSVDVETAASRESACRGLSDQFGYRVRLLPLRERKQDIPQLCEHLIERFARNFGRPAPRLSSSVLGAFEEWSWPGNIRELENWIARIVIFGTEEAIGLEFRRQMASRGSAVPVRHRAVRVNGSHLRRSRHGHT